MGKKNTLAGNKNNSSAAIFIKDKLGILVCLLLMIAVLAFSTENFMTSKNAFNIIRQISVNVFLACSMTMVIIVGGIDLSVGSIIAVAGCLSAGLITNVGLSAPVAVLIAIVIGSLIGAFNGAIICNTDIPPFIVTLATMNIGRGFARIYTKATTILVEDSFFSGISTAKLFGVVPIHLLYIIVIVAVSALILNRTVFGRNIYAVGDNMAAAKTTGVNVKRVKFLVFLISGVFAACAGILSASRTFSGQFSVGEGAEMDAISAVVLGGTSMTGGVGTLSGTVIGCLVIGVLNNGMNLMGIDSSWQYVVKGVVVLLAVLLDYFKKKRR